MSPESFIPPNPAKIGEYIGAGFEVGLNFANALSTLIIEFIGSIGKLIV